MVSVYVCMFCCPDIRILSLVNVVQISSAVASNCMSYSVEA